MPIEFRCTGCQKLLRTQEGTEGKQAKCPVCGTLVLIPNPNVPPALPGEAPPPIPAAVVPAAMPPLGTAPAALPGELVSAPLDVPAVLWSSWQIFLKNLGPCILATLVAGAVGFAAIFMLRTPRLGGAGRIGSWRTATAAARNSIGSSSAASRWLVWQISSSPAC